jgi:hypothetical protein
MMHQCQLTMLKLYPSLNFEQTIALILNQIFSYWQLSYLSHKLICLLCSLSLILITEWDSPSQIVLYCQHLHFLQLVILHSSLIAHKCLRCQTCFFLQYHCIALKLHNSPFLSLPFSQSSLQSSLFSSPSHRLLLCLRT